MVLSIVAAVIFVDQLAKFFVTANLSPNASIPVVKGVFHISYVINRGAAFGILKGYSAFFILSALAAAAYLIFSLTRKGNKKSEQISLSFILAGAIGNLIDRALFGYVIDFLDFRIWPVFNLADSSITVGAIMLAVSILARKRQKKCIP